MAALTTAAGLVMLVEDDPGDADLLRLALRRGGYATPVLWCAGPDEAFDILYRRGRHATAASPHPAVILMDLKMPGMNGIEATRKLRADAALACIPVVVFTSSNDPADVALAYAAGANSYVVKPVGSVEYNATVVGLARYWLDLNVTCQN